MQKVKILTLTSFALLSLLVSCSFNNVQDLEEAAGFNPCDTIPARWSIEVSNILATTCAQNFNPDQPLGCHQAGNTSSQGDFTDYATFSTKAQAGTVDFMVLAEGAPMPRFNTTGPDSLSNCDKNVLRRWIDAGAPNN